MSKSEKQRKTVQVRKYWSRSPIERPHSSKNGKRGYSRKAIKTQLKKGDY